VSQDASGGSAIDGHLARRALAMLHHEFFMSTDCDPRALMARATFSHQTLRRNAVVFVTELAASPARAGR
jgi:hypothetical protein